MPLITPILQAEPPSCGLARSRVRGCRAEPWPGSLSALGLRGPISHGSGGRRTPSLVPRDGAGVGHVHVARSARQPVDATICLCLPICPPIRRGLHANRSRKPLGLVFKRYNKSFP